MNIAVGIDAGSRRIKIVLWDVDADRVAAAGCADQGVRQEALATELLDRLLVGQGLDRSAIRACVATGYGRNLLRLADTTITEITCQARGVRYRRPDASTVVDIGGQDSKLIWLDASGRVRDFAMNDRCAGGTGRFLEIVADRLGVSVASLGELASRSAAPAAISSMCAVFAETEIVGLLAAGVSPADVAAGVQKAIATRVAAMAGGRLNEPIVFTGGVAQVSGMASALEAATGRSVIVCPDAPMTGAMGAALLAAERLDARRPVPR